MIGTLRTLVSGQSALRGSAKIDINKATEAELIKGLDGVGKKRAQAIIEFRKKKPIQNTDDLLAVPGIGPAIVAKNLAKLGLPKGKRSLEVRSRDATGRKGKVTDKSTGKSEAEQKKVETEKKVEEKSKEAEAKAKKAREEARKRAKSSSGSGDR